MLFCARFPISAQASYRLRTLIGASERQRRSARDGAAYALPEIGQDKDRWGSAKIAREEGSGRGVVEAIDQRHIAVDHLDRLDALLIEAAALASGDATTI